MNKSQFLAASAPDISEVEVPGLPDKVRVRVLTGRARDAFQSLVSNGDQSVGFFEAAIVVASVVDDAGEPMFTADDIETLRDVSTAVTSKVAAFALRLNKIGPAAEEEAAKN